MPHIASSSSLTSSRRTRLRRFSSIRDAQQCRLGRSMFCIRLRARRPPMLLAQVRQVAQPALVLIVNAAAFFNDALRCQLCDVLPGAAEMCRQCACADQRRIARRPVAPLRSIIVRRPHHFGHGRFSLRASIHVWSATEPRFSRNLNMRNHRRCAVTAFAFRPSKDPKHRGGTVSSAASLLHAHHRITFIASTRTRMGGEQVRFRGQSRHPKTRTSCLLLIEAV